MNSLEGLGSNEAKLRYLDGDFEVLRNGSFVRCAITKTPIPIDELKYWSVAKQEAYVDVEASVKGSQ